MMPVRNRESLVAESVASVLRQTEPDFELLILDDGSTDGTWQLVSALEGRDDRIRLFRNRTAGGIPAARNQLLAHARGRYLAITDSDDLFDERLFARERALLDADDRLAGVGAAIHVFSDDPAQGCAPGWHWGLRDGRLPMSFAGSMLRTEAVRAVGGFDPRYPVAEDVRLCYRLAGRGGRFATDPEVLIHYRTHGGSVSAGAARRREWCNLRAQAAGLRELHGRFTPRGYLVIGQSVVRTGLAAAGLRRS